MIAQLSLIADAARVEVLPEAAPLVVPPGGFRTIATVPWIKTVKGSPVVITSDDDPLPDDQRPHLKQGGGHYLRHEHEELILAVRGSPVVPTKLRRGTVVFAPHPRHPAGHAKAGQIIHSRKPAAFRDLAAAIGQGPRVELFAREAAPGWVAWGNEAPAAAPEGP